MNEKTKNPHLIGYMRVSTDDQEMKLQEDALLAEGVDYRQIFSDKMTGATMDRPGLQMAMKVARPGSTIVFWKFDRLGRSTRGVLETIDVLTKREINVMSITERFDTSSPMGMMFLSILISLAEMERNLISERTKAGIKAKLARGERMGRPHFVLSYPKRVKRFMDLYSDPSVDLAQVSAADFIAEMHKADRKAPEIKRPSSWYNWRGRDFIGLDAAIGIDPAAIDEGKE